MALKLLLLLLLWGLSSFLHAVGGCGNVSCSTDYSTQLNCSCAGGLLTQTLRLHVSCRGEEAEVSGSCEVRPSQSWCLMSPPGFEDVLSVDTMCESGATDGDGAEVGGSEAPGWALCDVVKPEPPSGVQVTNMEDFYNVTWYHGNQLDCLTYLVRIREAKQGSKEPLYSLPSDNKRLRVSGERLQARGRYVVDVKARMCPNDDYGQIHSLQGPWSEWSAGVELTPTAGGDLHPPDLGTAVTWHLYYITPSVLLVLVFVIFVLPYFIKNQQIPKPDHFFAPLYQTYGGNFKEWVNPVFKECDYFMVAPHVQLKAEHDVLQWTCEKQSSEDKRSGPSFLQLQAQDSPGVGRLLIHTVTVSGEEEDGSAHTSAAAPGRDRDRGRFQPLVEDMKEAAGCGLGEAAGGFVPVLQRRGSGDSSGENPPLPLHLHFFLEERASLDSLALNEQSEDGYPHVDLDTIDSGFGELSSPGAEQTPPQLQQLGNLQSNYVKQWVVCENAEG